MLIYYQSSIARNVPRNFLFPFLIDETTKAAYINIVAIRHGVLHHTEKSFHRCGHICFIHSCLFSDFVYYISFSHFVYL